MSDSEALESPINLGGLLPVALKRSCRECEWSAMEGGDRVCRRLPPQVTYIMVPEQKMVPTPSGPRPQQVMAIRNFCGFPVVMHEQWCGEFRQKVRS